MGIFNHDDRRIDHCADGDGDAAQAHDVGVDPLEIHDDKSNQDRHRQGKDGDQGAGEMEEKECRDQGNDNALLDQFLLERVDGALNQAATIINSLDRYPFRQACLESSSFRLTFSMVFSAFSP